MKMKSLSDLGATALASGAIIPPDWPSRSGGHAETAGTMTMTTVQISSLIGRLQRAARENEIHADDLVRAARLLDVWLRTLQAGATVTLTGLL